MQELTIVDDTKEFIKKIIFNIRYGRKFKKLNIDRSLSEVLIDRCGDRNEKDIFRIIRRSKEPGAFEENIRKYLKTCQINPYASALLLGNVTGRYVFNDFYYDTLENLNIDAFSSDNRELLSDLRSHFAEYVINDNRNKNTFATRVQLQKGSIRDLSLDIDQEKLVEDFDKVIRKDEIDDEYVKPKAVEKYIIGTMGTYSKEDIKDNFKFILYDMNKDKEESLDDRRARYNAHSGLSNNQLKKLDEVSVLRRRLQSMVGKDSEQLLSRLNGIEGTLEENISELEDIYSDYEALYRQDLVDNLYEPEEDIKIIEDYHDMKPQLIHQFIRSTDQFRKTELEKIESKIREDRADGNKSEELTAEEQERCNRMSNKVEANLDQFKVNYTMDGKEAIYSDSLGLNEYHSDTSNQISASVFEGKEFVYSSRVGIIGIGFNRQTLSPEAIAVSSNSYKTTNKGINNLEYDEENEFKEMSAPFSELIKKDGNSEVVMHRRGMDFDTKASYVFATIDSSDTRQTQRIMEQIKEVKEKEGLKAVIYDICKIRESIEKEQMIDDDREHYEKY